MGYVENIKSIMQWGNSFERQGNFPLDRTDLHISYDDAVLYAKGDASDSRKLGKLAYIGQTITVWGLNEKGVEGVWVYSLVPHTPADENDTTLADLKPVGSSDDIANLEAKVNVDITNLNNLIDDYQGTLGDVDDRLNALEAVEAITESDIDALFEGENEV